MRLLQSTRPTESKNLWKVSKLTIQRIIGKVKNTPWKEFVKTKLIWRDLFEKTHKKTCQVKTHWIKLARQKPSWKKPWKTFQKNFIQTESIEFFKKSNRIFKWDSFLSFWIEVTFESGFTVFSYDFSLLYIFPTRSEWNDVSIHHEKKQRGITGCSK